MSALRSAWGRNKLLRMGKTATGAAITGGAVVLVAALGIARLTNADTDLDGRYRSLGEIQLGDGDIISVSHSLRISGGRFYALSRQGDVILETTGTVETGFAQDPHLRVESGEVRGLSGELEDELVFNLLYGRQPGSAIHLIRTHGCLYAVETRQLLCPAGVPPRS